LKARLRDGYVEYDLGYHPLFQLVKCVKRVTQNPYLIGSFIRFIGFWKARFTFEKQNIPTKLKNYIKKEQFVRLFHIKL